MIRNLGGLCFFWRRSDNFLPGRDRFGNRFLSDGIPGIRPGTGIVRGVHRPATQITVLRPFDEPSAAFHTRFIDLRHSSTSFLLT